jgi:predicted DNA-binding transcriptional regulator AlpA
VKDPHENPKPTDMLKTAQVAQLTGLTVSTLCRWRERGQGPPTYRLGPKTHRYRRSEVMEWMQANRMTRPSP